MKTNIHLTFSWPFYLLLLPHLLQNPENKKVRIAIHEKIFVSHLTQDLSHPLPDLLPLCLSYSFLYGRSKYCPRSQQSPKQKEHFFEYCSIIGQNSYLKLFITGTKDICNQLHNFRAKKECFWILVIDWPGLLPQVLPLHHGNQRYLQASPSLERILVSDWPGLLPQILPLHH